MPENTDGSEEQPVAGLVDKAKEVAGTVAEKAGPAVEKAKESAGELVDKAKDLIGNKDDDRT